MTEEQKGRPEDNDINKYWPVFGRETLQTQNKPQKSFWDKGIGPDLDSDEITFEGALSRIGKKKKVVKTYHYKLIGNYLCYYKNANDDDYKAFIKLTRDVVLEKKQLKGKTEDFFYLEFSKDNNVRKLYSKESGIVKEWFKVLREKCILIGFKDYYQKIEALGSGSFATVYKIIRLEDNKMFAAKIYQKEKLEENKYKDKFVQMMLNEYEVLKNVVHQNISYLYEVYQEQDYCAYVMELVSGGEVYTKLKTQKRLKEEQAAEIIRDVSSALQSLHAHSYVHRDLKLENILLVNNIDSTSKLVDFGFAEKINRTQLVSKAGTPGFLPPELFKMAPFIEQGDIFSLGVILYCLVSGASPFKGKTYKEVLENNKKCTVSFDNYIWGKISEDCKILIKCMLEPNPDVRYNATDVLKSPWICKYFPYEQRSGSQRSISSKRTQKSVKRTRSRSKSKKFSKKENSLQCDESANSSEFSASTIYNWHGDNPKSFYKKSLKSIMTQKLVKSNEDYDEEVDNQSPHNIEQSEKSVKSPTGDAKQSTSLSQIQSGLHKNNNQQSAKVQLDLMYQCDVEEEDFNDLASKLKKLVSPEKKFQKFLSSKVHN